MIKRVTGIFTLLCYSFLLTACSSYLPFLKQEKITTEQQPRQPQRVISESQQLLEDKLLPIQSRSLLNQMSLIKKYPRDINNQAFIRQKTQTLKLQLAQKQTALINCSTRYRNNDLKLALECAQLAYRISSNPSSENALNQIEQRLQKNARKEENSKTAELKRRRNSLLALAKKQTQQSDHSTAIKTLNQLLKIAPDDKEAKQLLRGVKSIQNKHVAELIAMGDRLYRDENIEQALAVWKQAKSLSGYNEELVGKINRAEKVLGAFNKIKQLPPPPAN